MTWKKGESGNPSGKPPGDIKFADHLRRAIVQDEAKRVRAAAEALLDSAAEGDLKAISELADRLDGKPSQNVNLGGQQDNPLLVMESTESLSAHIRSLVAAREVIARVGTDREKTPEREHRGS